MAETIKATSYVRKASIDPIHGYTVEIKEIWLDRPYQICVNFGSVSVMSEERLNVFRSEEAILSCNVNFRGPPVEATNVKQIEVPKDLADRCRDYLQAYDDINSGCKQIFKIPETEERPNI